MYSLACCSAPVEGVGGWGDILGGIGDFFSSGVGLELVKAGISFGVGYGIHELTAPKAAKPQPAQPNAGTLLGVNLVNPAGSIYIPQAGGVPAAGGQPAKASVSPDWLLPVAILGAAAVFVLARK